MSHETQTPRAAGSAPVDVRNAVQRHRWVRIAGGIIIAVAVLALVVWATLNPRFGWATVGEYLFSPLVLRGVLLTLVLTAISGLGGFALGVIIALMRMSSYRPFTALATVFVWFFRSVPMIVQIIFWFNLGYLLPRIPVWFGIEVETNDLITPFTAAVIGLVIFESVYMSEIVRSGLISVDASQHDAAKALGFRAPQRFFIITLPQAMRVMIPPLGSQVISLMKGTSLVSVIGMTELLHSVQSIYQRTYEIVPMLLVATIWYLCLVAVLSVIQGRVEARLQRGFRRAGR